MKFFAVFAAVLAVACGQSTWTLNQLSDAIQNPTTDAALLPYLEQALNQMMNSIFSGQQVQAVSVTIPAVDFSSMSIHELSMAIQSPETDPALMPYLEAALNQQMEAAVSGIVAPIAAAIAIPAMDVTYWTLNELSDTLQSAATSPVLVPYLTEALNTLMHALMSGEQVEAIVIAIPSGLLPAVPTEVLPSPVVVPEAPVVVETPVVGPVIVESPEVSPVESPIVELPAASSPLVQIIVNINQQEAY